MKIVFVHLDWGIGGAEQLMLQLAMASKDNDNDDHQHEIQLLTTRCDPDHCFAPLRQRPCPFLHVYGSWIPSHIFGQGQVLCSTIRLLYLASVIINASSSSSSILSTSSSPSLGKADLIVTDVLPTPLIWLSWWTNSALLFYCHFPDQLLIQKSSPPSQQQRRQQQQEISNQIATTGTSFSWLQQYVKQFYRSIMNRLESYSMDYADMIVVNSQFTRNVVLHQFPHLAHRHRSLPILYPALESKVDETNHDPLPQQQNQQQEPKSKRNDRLIVSINRFERKKNLRILIDALAYLRDSHPDWPLPQVILAGGYDVRNVENVQHRGELGQLVKQYGLESNVAFEHSISDARKTQLLQTATAVVYTPENEHFGIVPIEAMAAGTPVICCPSGGPQETVLDNVTGIWCDPPTAAQFGNAIQRLLDNDALVQKMGNAARHHATTQFGNDRLKREWKELVQTTIAIGRKRVEERQQHRRLWYPLVSLAVPPLLVGLAWLILRLFLQTIHVLNENETVWQGVKRRFVLMMNNEP
jgi:alpha-1,3/alpha-1,6-mannosyltransferase